MRAPAHRRRAQASSEFRLPRIAKVTDHPAVIAAAAAAGTTPAQVGLAWQLAQHARTLLIPGITNPAHLADNIAVGGIRLDRSTLAILDRLAPAPLSV